MSAIATRDRNGRTHPWGTLAQKFVKARGQSVVVVVVARAPLTHGDRGGRGWGSCLALSKRGVCSERVVCDGEVAVFAVGGVVGKRRDGG